MRLFSVVGLLALIFIFSPGLKVFGDEPTYAERLGWPAGARVVIFHVDDAGMSHDSNRGAIEALENGAATSLSIMFTCPWATEIVRYVRERPQVDAGVHLTLTSEWQDYRWGPLAGARQVPSLVDRDGYFFHSVLEVLQAAKPDDVAAELRAQLDRCRAMGVEPTHLDSHMGTVFANASFMQRYLDLGIESGIPVMLPAGHLTCLTETIPLAAVPLRQLGKRLGQKLWDAGLPVLDDLHAGNMSGGPERKKAQVIRFLRTVKPGVTQFIVHCTRPSESFAAISSSGPMRQAELEAMLDPEVKQVIAEEGVILTTWRELKRRRDALNRP